jgi:hypothetical protein
MKNETGRKDHITGITVLGPLKTIHPLYQIFGVRLEMINFDNIINCEHKEHATDLNDSIEDIGLICPIVLSKKDNKYIIADGCSRYNFIKEHANSSICYIAKNVDEEKFLQQMNKKVFKLHKEEKIIRNFEFLFQDDIVEYTAKCTYLFSEGIPKEKILR